MPPPFYISWLRGSAQLTPFMLIFCPNWIETLYNHPASLQSIVSLCRNCEYEREFTLGVGMLYSSLEKAIDVVHYWNR
jgi:hypothetical protein